MQVPQWHFKPPVERGTMSARGCQAGRLHQRRRCRSLGLKHYQIMVLSCGVALQPLSCFQTWCATNRWIKGLFDHSAMHLGDEINSTATCCLFLSAEPMSWKPTAWIFLYRFNSENVFGSKVSRIMADTLAPYACKNIGFKASRRHWKPVEHIFIVLTLFIFNISSSVARRVSPVLFIRSS